MRTAWRRISLTAGTTHPKPFKFKAMVKLTKEMMEKVAQDEALVQVVEVFDRFNKLDSRVRMSDMETCIVDKACVLLGASMVETALIRTNTHRRREMVKLVSRAVFVSNPERFPAQYEEIRAEREGRLG